MLRTYLLIPRYIRLVVLCLLDSLLCISFHTQDATGSQSARRNRLVSSNNRAGTSAASLAPRGRVVRCGIRRWWSGVRRDLRGLDLLRPGAIVMAHGGC